MYLLARLFLNALAVMIITYLVPGVFVKDFIHAFYAAIVLGIVNALIRPVLLILSLPVNILSLGLFTLIINALMFWLASRFVSGFSVQGFGAAFWGALVFWIISWFSNALVAKRSQA